MKNIELYIIIIVALLFGVTLPLFNQEHVINFGNTSDIAMAIAAIYAAYRANKWFNDKSSINHLDNSHKFALQFEELLWKTNEQIFKDVISRQDIIFEIKNPNTDFKLLRSSIQEKIQKSIAQEVAYYGVVMNHRVMLNRYGISISKNLFKLTDEILDARNTYFNAHIETMHNILEVVTLQRTASTIDLSSVEKEMKEVAAIFEIKLANVKIKNDYQFH